VSGSLIIVLIIVVWLFVLAPLLLRGQKPIRRAGEAFDDTRVLYQGGTDVLPGRRRPRLTPADVRRAHETEEDDYEVVAAEEDVLLDDDRPSRTFSGSTAASAFKGMFTRKEEPAEEKEEVAEVVDGDIVHEIEAPEAGETAEHTDADESEVVTEDARYDEEDDERDAVYAYDDSYVSPADLMYPDTRDSDVVEVLEEEPADDAATDAQDDACADQLDSELDDELSDEDIEFAERRRGRGGYDPVADAEYTLTRYQRRQRTLIGLGAAVLVTAILAFILGGWIWALAGIALAATAIYLVALRNQVRQEEALRHRRIRQLRRASLGVRNAADEELNIPRNLRRPGAVVLELDDESPDFDYLPVTESHFEEDYEPAPRRGFRRLDRISDDRRAG